MVSVKQPAQEPFEPEAKPAEQSYMVLTFSKDIENNIC